MVLVKKVMDPRILGNDEALSAYQDALCSIVWNHPEVIVRIKGELKMTSRKMKML